MAKAAEKSTKHQVLGHFEGSWRESAVHLLGPIEPTAPYRGGPVVIADAGYGHLGSAGLKLHYITGFEISHDKHHEGFRYERYGMSLERLRASTASACEVHEAFVISGAPPEEP